MGSTIVEVCRDNSAVGDSNQNMAVCSIDSPNQEEPEVSAAQVDLLQVIAGGENHLPAQPSVRSRIHENPNLEVIVTSPNSYQGHYVRQDERQTDVEEYTIEVMIEQLEDQDSSPGQRVSAARALADHRQESREALIMVMGRSSTPDAVRVAAQQALVQYAWNNSLHTSERRPLERMLAQGMENPGAAASARRILSVPRVGTIDYHREVLMNPNMSARYTEAIEVLSRSEHGRSLMIEPMIQNPRVRLQIAATLSRLYQQGYISRRSLIARELRQLQSRGGEIGQLAENILTGNVEDPTIATVARRGQ